MVKLRYSSGNVISPHVHGVGVLAVGSHRENHGAALPIDTDSKIAAHIALQASLKTGATFLGILYAATEYDYVKHGYHLSVDDLVEGELKPALRSAKKCLDLKKVILVNGHGGNVPIIDHIKDIEGNLDLEIIFNNRVVEIEGPHAGTGELSMAAFLGFLDEKRVYKHCNFEKYPEVGMVGLDEARAAEEGINKGALEVEKKGVCVDKELGKELLEDAVESVVMDIKEAISN
ncbi:2-amino-5-formylamino-6-ribosylaminopyrimidin-4(3H)-one 5'-monophosphate deformylase [Methanobacterium congolense]|uniref:2-amino-5-formylamino-6-ribosylaminopyrimidin-4(3H)-one 5'-monophosphate deformylase n=1 Tax=Methanobacterium congolense TaxID=118062 RepID=A0A1D3L0M6_9EURY|nr:2-amino-5-formylamino-6-ribosylaminopyrimidin-4(3H)-one 5'-monophosphate deformylase [Methanobacterium congolense]SCG85093.1 2-amino-5-formylamino-6-ribosylaminopyrimidin-4(3H)-one 5'-monophosphate deformylase [Methanobacterium congolense]